MRAGTGSAGFKAFIDTTEGGRSLSSYKTVLDGSALFWKRTENALDYAMHVALEHSCTCTEQEDSPGISIVPATHEFSCPYRRDMQPVLEILHG